MSVGLRVSFLLVGILAVSGCAIGGARTATPAAGAVASLERERVSDPRDAEAALMLAAAYLFEDRAPDAGAVVEAVRARYPDEPGALLLGGTVEETAGNAQRARAQYRAYLDADRDGAFAPEVLGRLQRLEAAALLEQLRDGVPPAANATPQDSSAVVVLPFANRTGDPLATPFAVAAQELLGLDLSVTGQLHTVDGDQVRVVLRALAPDPTTWGDPTLAERVGRFFGAGLVVQGTLTAQAPGVWLARGTLIPLTPRPGPLLFEVPAQAATFYTFAKQLALMVYERAGVQISSAARATVQNASAASDLHGMEPTPSEQTRVARGQTQFTEPWMEYGQGLIAVDSGGYGDAERHFEEAARFDAGFTLARERARGAIALAASAQPARTLAWQAAQVQRQQRSVAALAGAPSRVDVLRALDPRQRAGLADLLGQALGTATPLELNFVIGELP